MKKLSDWQMGGGGQPKFITISTKTNKQTNKTNKVD